MNRIEKKSFYSFLFLYLGSSFIFVFLSGYWYYSAQKQSLENTTYYKLQHTTDMLSSLIINAHMMKRVLELPQANEGCSYLLIPIEEQSSYKEGYFEEKKYKVLVSSSPQEHLGIKYVVAKNNMYHIGLKKLQKNVLSTMIFIFTVIVIISWILSKLFMRPMHEKMNQIEQFIQDLSHELNTPITALTMSSKRSLQKKVFDEKALRNISISTKQLYSIYKSLAYLNFSSVAQTPQEVELKPLLEQSLEYYKELIDAKGIILVVDIKDTKIDAIDSRMELLFSNLLSNAIKYSMPNTTIRIELRKGYFSIEDEGVGIASDKLDEIFNLYERNSSFAGGFGIGLNIVKKICYEFGINIEVESKLQKGSCFTLKW